MNITAFVAGLGLGLGLGVGGIAVTLAAQNILGDLFASLAIVLDKPFEVGDFIVLGGEQVAMSNTELLKQTVSNYKRLAQRRIVFGFGVRYGTPPDLLARIPGIGEQAVKSGNRLRFDRAHFKAPGESSLDFEVVLRRARRGLQPLHG